MVRDLFRSQTQPEQSYSERQLYEAALDRLSREISAVQRITETEAVKVGHLRGFFVEWVYKWTPSKEQNCPGISENRVPLGLQRTHLSMNTLELSRSSRAPL